MPDQCPCCSGRLFDVCCAPFLDGTHVPQTPEQLMRSPAANSFNPTESKNWAQGVNWLGLKVLSSSQEGDCGTVSFVASYEQASVSQNITENSVFQRIDGVWYYTDRLKEEKLGRNALCLCGSGKKYKHCCLRAES